MAGCREGKCLRCMLKLPQQEAVQSWEALKELLACESYSLHALKHCPVNNAIVIYMHAL
jgi:hypothetical protein